MMRFVLVSTLALTVAFGAAAQTADDTRRNENVARHFFESSNRNDIGGMLADLTEDAKNFGRPVGREGFRMVLNDIFTTFPDWHVEIVEMVAKDDSVVMRCKVSGTHRGVGKIPVNGGMLVGVAPTGDRKSTRLNSSHVRISYAVFCFLAYRDLHSFPTRRSSDLGAKASEWY